MEYYVTTYNRNFLGHEARDYAESDVRSELKNTPKTLVLELFTASSASVWTSKILQQLGMSNLEDRCWGHNPENPGISLGFFWVHQKLSFLYLEKFSKNHSLGLFVGSQD
jgi:hypothetical protein